MLDLTDIESTRSYRWQTAHSNTVVFNEALVRDTLARFPEINVFGMNPGVIKTNIMAGVLGQSSFNRHAQPIAPNSWLVADDHCARVVEAAEALSARVLW